MSEERRKVPLVYVPYGILPFDKTTLRQNPIFVTGRADSLCVPWGKKCKILHCWVPKGEKGSDWLRQEVHYLVEVEPTPPNGVCSSSWWKTTFSRWVNKMAEDIEICPIITVTSREHLDKLHGREKLSERSL